MTCRLALAGVVLVSVLSCQPPIHAQALVPAGNPEGERAGGCSPSSLHEHQPGPEVRVAELIFEGDLRMPISDQDEIARSIKELTYWGEPDAVVSEVTERARLAWLNHGYFKVQLQTDAHLLTSSPVSQQIAVTVHVEDGQQYRLEKVSFRNNRAIINVKALRNLFPINDGDVFDRAAVAQGLENLRLAYGEFGYVNFTSVPETQFNEERRTISLNIDMDEGKQFYVSSISLLGLDDNLKEDSPLQTGNIYNQRLARLFVQEHAPSSLADVSPDSRIHLQLDERARTLAITFDLRDCPDKEQR